MEGRSGLASHAGPSGLASHALAACALTAGALAASAALLSGCSSDAPGATGAPDAASSDAEGASADATSADAGTSDASEGEEAACTAPCDGECIDGRCLVTLAQVPSPVSLVIDAVNAYVSSCPSGDGGTVVSVPLDGGSLRVLASGQGCGAGLAIDSASLYVAGLNGGDVMSVPLDGGAPTTLASGSDTPIGITLGGASVYWTTAGGALMTAPIAGGAPAALTSGETYMTGPVAGPSDVYWASDNALLQKVALDGGSPASVTTLPAATALAIAGTDAYVAGGYIVTEAPLGGGQAMGLCNAGGAPTFAIAADDASVYFTTYDMVWKVARSGGQATVVASNQGSPNALAVDATSVYWTDGTDWPPPPGGGGGRVMKLTPK